MSSFAQRRSSGLQVRTPQPGRTSSQHSRRSSGASIQISPVASHIESPLNTGLGLGVSLADELEDGWDEDGGDGGGEDEEVHGGENDNRSADDLYTPHTPSRTMNSGVTHHSSPDDIHKTPVRPRNGNDRNNEDDHDDNRQISPSKAFTPFLERGMADIDALARQGSKVIDASDGIWERAITQLRDLPPQLKLENFANRLMTAQAAVAAHVEDTSRSWPLLTRAITTPAWALASAPVVGPAADSTPGPPPSYPAASAPSTSSAAMPALLGDPDSLAALDALVTELVDLLPKPLDGAAAHEQLQLLNAQTSDLLEILSAVTDQLHMQKQASAKAAQKLKAVRDVVVALRRELETGDQAAQWLDAGRWHARLQAREAAGVCKDVVRGFEEHCDMWRNRLIMMHGGQGNGSIAIDVSAQ